MKTRKIAFSRLMLKNGEIIHREVVEFDENGLPLRHYPLSEELPFVEWEDKTFTWPNEE